MPTKREFLGGAVATGLITAAVSPAKTQALPHIRWGHVLPPMAQVAGLFTKKPEILKNLNKTYTFEAVYLRGAPLLVTALASKQIDIANLAFFSLYLAVSNAGLSDLRVIFDECEDNIDGHFSSEMRVLKDSGINRIEDMKGKIAGISVLGSASDLQFRNMMRKHDLEFNRDYTFLETPIAAAKAMLLERKIHAGFFAQPFASDPEVIEKTKVLFTTADSMGNMMANFVVGRGDFLKANRAAMVDFMEDYFRLIRWYYDPANRKEALEIVSQVSKIPAAVLDTYLFTIKDNYRPMDGIANLAAIQSNMKVQKELGFAKSEINVEDHADLSMIKEAAARFK